MTRKIYKSAMGKTVDLGALLLQNEQVRAVGNMGVNAAGDMVDSANKVIDRRNRQVQKQYRRQTNVSAEPVYSSKAQAKKQQQVAQESAQVEDLDIFDEATTIKEPQAQAEPEPTTFVASSGGLAAAIARSKEIKQELEKTPRQLRQEQGLKKI